VGCGHARDDTTGGLGGIRARTLLVRAAQTRRPIRELRELLFDAALGWRLVEVPDAGHMAPITRPELVNPIVVDFLERLEPRRPT
jgi:pimeloyl-ACP methyl ester carboxylesterase